MYSVGREDPGGGIEVGPLLRLIDRTRGEGSHLVALHHLGVHLLLLPLSFRGPLRTSHAAQTETLEVLVRHSFDEGLAEGHHVGAEVRRSAIPLVTIEPGKRENKN